MIADFSIDHLQTAIPVGSEEVARGFYGGLLGLEELPKPEDMAQRGGCWFRIADRQLHLGADPNFIPAKKAHVALRTHALALVRQTLETAGYVTHDDTIVEGRERFFSHDPFGNRIEFMDMPLA